VVCPIRRWAIGAKSCRTDENMTEPNPQNHWDSLISDLGATPPAEEESLRQSGPTTPQPSGKVKPASAARRPRSAASANWDLIADELGVAPAPRPIAPPRESVETAPAPTEPQRQVPITPESGEESPNFFDEQFDFEEPFDLLESAPESGAAPQTVEPEEKRPRKRSRRRPRRESEVRETRRPAPPAGADDRSASAADDESGRVDAAEEGEVPGVERPLAEPAPPEQRRSKHRRPRRGKKRRTGDEPMPAMSPVALGDGESAESSGETAFHGDGDPGEDAEEDADRQRRGERSVRAGFRGIPTWSEAVGLIIEKNLEGRAKRPGGGSQRGRGKKRRS